MKIAIYGSRQYEGYSTQMQAFMDILAQAGADVVMHRKLYDVLVHTMPLRLSSVRKVVSGPDFSADVALSIGGDGTFLRTAMWVGDKQIPILGVNAGHLGYLSGATIDELPTVAQLLLNGEFAYEGRSLLRVECEGMNTWPYALNEVAVAKEESASMIVANTQVNGKPLAAYRADGLIVSTPTGSTAYNLSVGGPIVEPTAPVWILAPIAAHSLGMRPLVVGDSAEIAIKTEGRARSFRLSLDGRPVTLSIETEVRLRKADFPINIVSRPNHTFAEALREKLHWNE